MNVQADREALQSFLRSYYPAGNIAPTGAAYIACDGTLWHQFTDSYVDGEIRWYTSRVNSAFASFTYRITNDTMVLEDVF